MVRARRLHSDRPGDSGMINCDEQLRQLEERVGQLEALLAAKETAAAAPEELQGPVGFRSGRGGRCAARCAA